MIPLVYFLTIGGLVLGVLVGYGLARLDALCGAVRQLHDTGSPLIMESRRADFFTKHRASHAESGSAADKIEIDARTVVTEINTGGLVRASQAEMGKTTTETDSTMQQSVSRLSQLKGK